MKPIILTFPLMCWIINQKCEADRVKFVSSSQYLDMQMVTDLVDFFPLKLTPKDGKISIAPAKIDCSLACKANASCWAFNFYETEGFYTCELLPDNFCSNRAQKALVPRNGSSVWEKIPADTSKACVEQKYVPGSTPCSFLQPGCLGTWPNCSNCCTSCNDCYSRGIGTGRFNCTFWPEKDVPVFGRCVNQRIYLFIRHIDVNTGNTLEYYRMRFSDIWRLRQLETYPKIKFFFAEASAWYSEFYTNWAISENGTLLGDWISIAPYWGTPVNSLNINGQSGISIPFVEVTDDRYGCGSYWLLDRNNSTYCPGGVTGIFGAIQKDGAGKVLSTGIKVALENMALGKLFYWGSVELDV